MTRNGECGVAPYATDRNAGPWLERIADRTSVNAPATPPSDGLACFTNSLSGTGSSPPIRDAGLCPRDHPSRSRSRAQCGQSTHRQVAMSCGGFRMISLNRQKRFLLGALQVVIGVVVSHSIPHTARCVFCTSNLTGRLRVPSLGTKRASAGVASLRPRRRESRRADFTVGQWRWRGAGHSNDAKDDNRSNCFERQATKSSGLFTSPTGSHSHNAVWHNNPGHTKDFCHSSDNDNDHAVYWDGPREFLSRGVEFCDMCDNHDDY